MSIPDNAPENDECGMIFMKDRCLSQSYQPIFKKEVLYTFQISVHFISEIIHYFDDDDASVGSEYKVSNKPQPQCRYHSVKFLKRTGEN